ncbi:FIST C-terminal domain-containing protein [candidate division WOR-3 bacterium]|nr:FIST C-terminal domain-containing protein [candidate division WOR-3 bacterium]
MKVFSHFSLNPDPYKAGLEIAEKIARIDPEIVFIFPTIHYEGSPETAEAMFDVIGKEDMVLVGNTGEGFYEKNKVSNSGVSALAVNSCGKIKWYPASADGMISDPFSATKSCIEKVNRNCNFSFPVLYFLASDFRADAKKITNALSETVRGPLIGGFAGDEYSFTSSFLYYGREVLTDSIVAVAINGDFEFDIKIAHELQPIGSIGRVTCAEGTRITEISGMPAMNFVEKQIGKPLNVVDQGIITFKVTETGQKHGHKIRSVMLPKDRKDDKSIILFSAIDEGDNVQVCLAPPEMMLKDIKDIGESMNNLSFKPSAALIVSCAGRKKVLADDIEIEVKTIASKCPSLKGLAGYPSFGEFGSVKNKTGYTKPLFHNMTFLILLLGDKEL